MLLLKKGKCLLFLKEINGFMLNVTGQCLVSPASSKAVVEGVPAIRDIKCLFLRNESEVRCVSANFNTIQKVMKHFCLCMFPPLLLHFHLSDEESLGVKLQFTIHIFFRTAVLRQLFDIEFSYKHCKFLTRLPTRQDGVENRDKVYSHILFVLFT